MIEPRLVCTVIAAVMVTLDVLVQHSYHPPRLFLGPLMCIIKPQFLVSHTAGTLTSTGRLPA